jgi:hypothetical protein
MRLSRNLLVASAASLALFGWLIFTFRAIVILWVPRQSRNFLSCPCSVHQIAIVGFDCITCQAASAQKCVGALQGALFCHFACGNPSGLIGSEAPFFCAPELN